MKTAILLGSNSDIAKGIRPMLEADGWTVHGWKREHMLLSERNPEDMWNVPHMRWDLVISAIGTVYPVGLWRDSDYWEFERCIASNLLVPAKLLRSIWKNHNTGAKVCMMAGSNPQKIMTGYCPYNVGKMALLKFVEQIDHEEEGVTIFALGPGYIPTKIHQATLDAKWPNERIARGGGNTFEQVYETLKWCLSQPKEVVGGRNICVSDVMNDIITGNLKDFLEAYKHMFKLRRWEP